MVPPQCARLYQIQSPGSATGIEPRIQEGQTRRPPRLDLIQALGSMRVFGVEIGLDELQSWDLPS